MDSNQRIVIHCTKKGYLHQIQTKKKVEFNSAEWKKIEKVGSLKNSMPKNRELLYLVCNNENG